MRLTLTRYLLPSSHYVLLALLFFAGLQLAFWLHQWIVPLFAGLFVLMVIGILLVRIEEQGRFRIMQAILPILAVIGLTGFGLFLPPQLLQLYFISASLLLFWLLKHGAKMAYPTWNWTLSTIVFFLDTAALLGVRFHLYVPIIIILGGLLIISFLISLQALRRITPTVSEAILIALTIGIGLTQLAWTLQFLPLHYVVQAGILVAFYYVFFHLISVSYERPVRFKDIAEYALIGAAALGIILINARWR
ncbi:MAG: hypothetical protein WEA04_02675 [Candidatus Andersenbacteria bacterium]